MKNFCKIYPILFMLLLGSMMLFIETGCSDPAMGCTDPAADNYDPEAEENDGSCVISGCTDPDAENYSAQANNDDGSCTYARDKYIGDFSGSFTCNVLPLTNDSFTFTIAPGFESNLIIITITNGVAAGISLSGSVSGSTITVNTTLPPLPLLDIDGDENPDPLVLTVTGTVTGDGNSVSGPLDIAIALPDGTPVAQDVCTIEGTKQ